MKMRVLTILILLFCLSVPVFAAKARPKLTDAAISRTKSAVTKALKDRLNSENYDGIIWAEWDGCRLTAVRADTGRTEKLKADMAHDLTERLLATGEMTFKIGVLRIRIALNEPVKAEFYSETAVIDSKTRCRLTVRASAEITVILPCQTVKTEVTHKKVAEELVLDAELPEKTAVVTDEIWRK